MLTLLRWIKQEVKCKLVNLSKSNKSKITKKNGEGGRETVRERERQTKLKIAFYGTSEQLERGGASMLTLLRWTKQ